MVLNGIHKLMVLLVLCTKEYHHYSRVPSVIFGLENFLALNFRKQEKHCARMYYY